MLDVRTIKIAGNITKEELENGKSDYIVGEPNLFQADDNNLIIVHNNKLGGYYIIDKGRNYPILPHYVEDYFNKGYIFQIGKRDSYSVISKIEILSCSTPFDIRNGDTYGRFRIVESIHSINVEKLKSSFKINKFYSMLEKTIYDTILTEEELNKLGFIRGKQDKNLFFFPQELEYVDGMIPYRKFNHTYYKVDNFEGLSQTEITEIRKDNLRFGVDSLTYKAFEGISNSYGIEIETIAGRIPEGESDNLNWKTVHDGSLRGPNGEDPIGAEYVTGVLKGDSGLVQLSEMCRLLTKYCKIDKRCGNHVHIGTLNWNKEEVVFAYLLGELIEKDLFQMLPKSRRDNSYCRPLTKLLSNEYLARLRNTKKAIDYKLLIDECYDIVYKEVAYSSRDLPNSIISSPEINKKRNHPKGSKCGYNKNSQRYTWLNFVTLLFDTKGIANSHTLEFRPMSASMNFKKIRNWLKICLAFCKFVENFKSDILNSKITTEFMISKIYPKTGKQLIEYIQERKELFKSHGESIDYVEETIPSKQSLKEVAQCV